VTDIPPGWHDDPEDPQQYRYWDGSQWTEHRSPRSATPTAAVGGAWNVIGVASRLAVASWRELVLLALPMAAASILSTLLVLSAIDAALEPDLADIQDKFSESGFDPFDDAEGAAYIESISFTADWGSAAMLAGGVVLFLVSGLVVSTAFSVHLASARRGRSPALASSIRLALSRLPRVIGVHVLWSLVLAAIAVAIVLLAVVAPLTLLLTVPALFASLIYLYPTMLLSVTALTVGNQQEPPFRSTFTLVRPQWRRVAVQVLVLSLVLAGLALAINLAASPFNAASVWAGFLVSSLFQTVQTAMNAAGGVVVYEAVGGEFDSAVD